MATDSTDVDLRRLEDDLAGQVILPSDDGWDAARQAWTWPSTKGRLRSFSLSPPTTSSRPFASPHGTISGSRSTQVDTTRARSTGARTSCS